MKAILLPLALILGFSVPVLAQTPTDSASTKFPFVIPWDDASPGTATDVSFLNSSPAGSNGFIVVKDGHFYETKTGRRINFLGTALVGGDAFPEHADAEKVAARMAKLGINIVRLHHMDNSDWGPKTDIWDYSFADRQHISASQFDKLDYLIAQLKKNGIYVNINLHVSRTFSQADGFPASISQIPTQFDKRVDEFDPRMIELQKKYAHDLLTHVNPYTGLSYAEDPAVAVVEINNENSLVGDPWAQLGAELDTLPDPFRSELKQDWNVWLAKKYGNDAALKTAWMKGVTPIGPEINGNAQWTAEAQGDAKSTLTLGADESRNAGQQVEVDIPQIDATVWHVQAHQIGLDLQNDTTYTVTFKAKADSPRSMSVGTTLDESDWHNVGLDATAAVTTDWKTFSYVFTADQTVPDHARITFILGNQAGTVWISDLNIHAGAEGAGLPAGQSLSDQTVDIPVSALKSESRDWISFLADTERAYAENMRSYLKDTLHVHANIICSQDSWGGLTGINRETNMDFADNHAYWQHPSFPGKQWDPINWNIQNTPMVGDLAAGGGGTLRDLAEYRVAKKPYTISEYNQPAPSDYRSETLPVFASFAARQDWDMIYIFDYGAYGAAADNEKINDYFGLDTDPAKSAFLPAAAMIFRASEMPVATDKETLNLTPGQLGGVQAYEVWQKAGNGAEPDIFKYKITLQVQPDATSNAPQITKTQTDDDAGSSQVVTTSSGAQYLAVSSEAQAAAGYVGGETVNIGDNSLTFPAFGDNFAAFTLTAMDLKPLSQSHKVLLTLVGKVENEDMVWNADRTSVGNQWGHGPTVAEGIPATVAIRTDTANAVWALDPTGHRATEVPSTLANGLLTFTVGAQYKTLWYEIGAR